MVRWIPIPALIVCTLCLSFSGCQERTQSKPELAAEKSAEAKGETNTVEVMIDFADDAKLTIVVKEIGEPVMVEEIMRRVAKHPRAPTIEISGTGLTGFIASIGDQNTAGGYGWLYEVNGKRAERGIGQTEVRPGDRILWSYEKW